MELQWSYFVVLIISIWNLHLANAAGCDSSPCQNGGVCFDQMNDGFFCLCVLGFTGLTCVGDVPTDPPAVEPTTLKQTTTQATTTQIITTIRASTTMVTTAQSSSTEPRQTTAKMTSASTGSISTQSTETAALSIESKGPSTDPVDSTDSLTNTERAAVTSPFITSNRMSTILKSTKDASEKNPNKPPPKGSVGDEQGSLLWLLLLILIVMLLVGGIVTVWAVKKSAKSHGAYSPNSVSNHSSTMQGDNNGSFQGPQNGHV